MPPQDASGAPSVVKTKPLRAPLLVEAAARPRCWSETLRTSVICRLRALAVYHRTLAPRGAVCGPDILLQHGEHSPRVHAGPGSMPTSVSQTHVGFKNACRRRLTIPVALEVCTGVSLKASLDHTGCARGVHWCVASTRLQAIQLHSVASITPPPRQISPWYRTADCPGVTAHWGWWNKRRKPWMPGPGR